ncbi:MAG: hypothetical protein CVU44_11090 [Chloroflexi bacterium HGW-Chloroflexi-6]|nr:MAG: hypothetical protein CVU44_11090 [Chloroflexi bacterium HGW-Chloroflexi-6]
MSKPIRHAIWAAVSTAEQAEEDRYSLETQEQVSRSVAKSKNWVESAGPYIVPGESRTKYINLSDAEREIPALRQMLDDAKAGKFDVIICYEYDRFRELLDPVARTLAHYGVQIFSVNQPLELQDPATFTPYSSDAEFILRGMNQIISRAAVANLRRKYLSEMPKRVTQKGLPAANMPWGYRKPAGQETVADAIPELIPEIVPILHMMKDMILAGQSSYQVKDKLEQMQVPIPKKRLRLGDKSRTEWDPTTIVRILRNPFYAGRVRWGVTKTHRDLRTGTRRVIDQTSDKILTGPGKHQPVWDWDTHLAILAELDRRRPWLRGHVTRQLSALLRCSVCGATLWRHSLREKRPPDERIIAWRCSVGHASHMVQTNDDMLEKVAAKFTEIISANAQETESIQTHETELADLRKRRARIGDGFEGGLFDLEEFSQRVASINEKIKALETIDREMSRTIGDNKARQAALEALRAIAAEVGLLTWMREADHQEVNKTLSYIVSHFVIDPQGNIIETVIK